ncbi:MAG: MaoC family dehydratase N-terminal domain-containing protein [Chloroflexi bacterium]|nr:MaoC family dehydratase N-terminal domain-containing protein [Chloroflexota bacterium]
MAQGPLVTETVRKFIGAKSEAVTMDIEEGHIRRFADAIQDPNPLYHDRVAARASRYGGIIAPPAFLRAIRMVLPKVDLNLPLTRLLDGGSDWEYYHPVRAGDTITAVTRLADIREREGRAGKMVFVIHETTYTNQLRQVVARQRSTMIRY